MKILVATLMFTVGSLAHAFESEMTFTWEELAVSAIVARNKGADGKRTPTFAERVIQLQLEATNCQPVIITPDSISPEPSYTFKITSDNCKIIAKGAGNCGAGFAPRNMAVNPNSRDGVIIGKDKYIVCVKSGTGEGPSAPAK